MPVTARLSKRFYETLGEDVANAMVDWFNAVDATYKADLRDLIEAQALRFRAEIQQGLAELRAEMHGELANVRTEMHAGFAQLRMEMASGSAALRTEMVSGSAALRSEMANLRAELIKWMFLFWLGTVAATLAGVFAR